MFNIRSISSNILGFLAVLAFCGVFVVGIVWQQRFECSDEPVTVKRGDNLWSLVGEHCDGDPRAVIEAMKDAGLETTVLQEGQVLVFP
jgi:hypothetical protein